MASSSHDQIRLALRARVTCPHCWHAYAPEDSLWISQHPDLLGDARLGPEQQLRFLPTRFTVDGAAVDPRGFSCTGLACPRCHLPVPRALLELQPFFLSILGAPGSGKSYFLTAMTWALRQTMPRSFLTAFGDADPTSNRSLNEYEERLFLNEQRDQVVTLDKTALEGNLYNTVLFGGQSVSYSRPFIFAIRPLPEHPNADAVGKLARAVCLYDNAGEHFLPGADSASSPVTRHLAQSRVLYFVFDPTQDPRFRAACSGKSDDPQMHDRARTSRQETVLLEAADRIRKYTGLAQNVRHRRPLVVVLTKFDAWSALLGHPDMNPPWVATRHETLQAFDIRRVDDISARCRKLLWELTPELVSAAEGFAKEVVYIPVSAMGHNAQVDQEKGHMGIRPSDLEPKWTDVPLVYALARWSTGLIPSAVPKAQSPPPPVDDDPKTIPRPRLWGTG